MSKELNFGPEYPTRPKFFCLKAIRLMSHYGVCRDVGPIGHLILIEVVLTEDRVRYGRAPKFWQSSLQERFGYSRDAISKAIQRCKRAGWLHWDQPHRGQATAWLTIPPHVDESALMPDDFMPEKTAQNNFAPENLAQPSAQHLAQRSAQDQAQHLAQRTASPIPNPNQFPAPSPKEAAAAWMDLERKMVEIGIGETSEPLRLLKARFTDTSLALGVLRHASERKAWRPGAIRRRLMNLFPEQDPKDERLWMKPGFSPIYQAPAAVAGGNKFLELEREVIAKKKQVLIDWEKEYGPVLDAMTDDEARELCPEQVRPNLKALKDWRIAPLIRPYLLETLAQRAKA